MLFICFYIDQLYCKVFCGLCFELIIIIIIIFTYDGSLWILTIVWLLLNDIKVERNETFVLMYFTLANFWLYIYFIAGILVQISLFD